MDVGPYRHQSKDRMEHCNRTLSIVKVKYRSEWFDENPEFSNACTSRSNKATIPDSILALSRPFCNSARLSGIYFNEFHSSCNFGN